ncbi:MAG: hypothetical protein M3R06_09375 [Chloroflexota bacterium]|nr:hypothetical protein [Chloroflexota bacterium]
MYLGWYDPDKKRPARLKLSKAVERYVEKFGLAPDTCLTHPSDAEELTNGGSPALGVAVRGVSYIPRNMFYIGVDDDPAETPALAA